MDPFSLCGGQRPSLESGPGSCKSLGVSGRGLWTRAWRRAAKQRPARETFTDSRRRQPGLKHADTAGGCMLDCHPVRRWPMPGQILSTKSLGLFAVRGVGCLLALSACVTEAVSYPVLQRHALSLLVSCTVTHT